MARLTVPTSLLLLAPKVRLLLDGKLRQDLVPVSLTRNFGANPVILEIMAPRLQMENDANLYEDKEVVLYLAGGGDIDPARPAFRGWIGSDNRTETAFRGRTMLRARSPLGYLRGVHVGQKEKESVVRYPLRDRAGNYTDWTMSRIIEDMFSNDRMPAEWRTQIALGDISVLQRADTDLSLGGFEFPATAMRDALRAVLGRAGHFGVTERFESDKTFLDFYMVNDPVVSVRKIVAPTGTQGPSSGGIVTSIAKGRDSNNAVNRVIAYGANELIMLSLSTRPSFTGPPLEPAWPSASAYVEDVHLVAPGDLTADEAAVLANPQIGQRGAPGFNPRYENIFRLFRLPRVLHKHIVDVENAYRTSEKTDSDNADSKGKRLPPQFYKDVFTYAATSDPGVTERASGIATFPEILQGGRIEGAFIRFAQPVIAPYEYGFTSANAMTRNYRRVHANLTISIRHAEKAPTFDTGIRGNIDLSGVETEGITLPLKNNAFEFTRIGSETGEFIDTDRTAYTFKAVWYDPTAAEGSQWKDSELIQGQLGDPIIVDDDRFPDPDEPGRGSLQVIAESALFQRGWRETRASIALPGVWDFTIGEMCSLENRGINGKKLQVVGVRHALTTMDTQVDLTDAQPQFIAFDRVSPEDNLYSGYASRAAAAGGTPPTTLPSSAGATGGERPAGTLAEAVERVRAGGRSV